MSKTAYIFIFLIIGLSLLLHALDERSDRVVIGQAASIALYDGVMKACEERNSLRDRVAETAIALHPESRRDELRIGLRYENCDKLAKKAIDDFQRQLHDKSYTEQALDELTGRD